MKRRVDVQWNDLTLSVLGEFTPSEPAVEGTTDNAYPANYASFEIDSITYRGQQQLALEHSTKILNEIAELAVEVCEQ